MLDIVAFLEQNPEYAPVLQKAVEHEEANSTNEHYLGWEWYDVQMYGSKLPKLVVEGIARIDFKSRSTTAYKLVNREAVRAALTKPR